ncbi:MAG TPA: uracil-DNA glycosylase [Rhizomicrobium sp.]|nr:uracil-DNA glycosylase [Rhizomicrobium sp.]
MPRSEVTGFGTLRWLMEAGADESIGERPVNRFRPAPTAPPSREFEASVASGPRIAATTPPLPNRVSDPPAGDDPIGRAMAIAAACATLLELKAAVEAFEGCALKRHATKTVFADGTPVHRILFIGEAPGKDEDAAGLPFVGRAGKLLDRMLAAIGLDRKTNVYITNVLNWRPPGNRDPAPEEAAACLPFLRRHIELVAPEIIVLLGAVAARHVMGRSDGIMRLRGNWLEYHVGGRMVPVMPTLHPAYVLRRPIDKRLAWRDLQAISTKVDALGLLEPGDAAR